ncbi:uncharacterized protein LOC134226841 [Armigeres subalbatus]|uniref:uncharacterized protein LOC134226841 n=1 Tax=Armigeres subalbatus TaxID=124917 RepID=UPI002ED57C89
MLDAKLERAVGTAKCKPVKSVESRSTQTEAQGFADSGKVESTEGVPAKTVVPKSTQTEAQVFAGTSGVTAPTEQTQKRGRQSPGDELPGGRFKTRRVTTPNKGSGAGKLNLGQVPPKPGEEGPGKVRPPRKDGGKGLRQAESSQPHQTREIEGEGRRLQEVGGGSPRRDGQGEGTHDGGESKRQGGTVGVPCGHIRATRSLLQVPGTGAQAMGLQRP